MTDRWEGDRQTRDDRQLGDVEAKMIGYYQEESVSESGIKFKGQSKSAYTCPSNQVNTLSNVSHMIGQLQ